MVLRVCLLLAFFFPQCGAMADEITLVPLVYVTGGYDDNVYYTRADKETDYVATVKPGFTLDYDSELFNIRSSGSVDFLRYLHNSTNLNRENYYLLFDGGVNLTERWNLRGNFSFINDTTLDSQLEETGIVTLRTDRKRYDGGGELSYRLTDLSNVGLSYNHQTTRYGSDLYEDYDYDSVRFSYDYRFNDGLDIFTVLPYYDYWRSDISTVSNYGLSFGLSHTFDETLSLEAFLGARYTQTERIFTRLIPVFDPNTGSFRLTNKEVKAKDNNWGGTANIQLKKRWELSSVSFGYSHDLTYASTAGDDAEPINVDRIFCSADHKITSRFRAGFSGSFYISESASTFGNRDDRYIQLTPSLDYDITKNYSLRLAYSYSRQLDKRLETDPDQYRNRVWLTFGGKFPMKW